MHIYRSTLVALLLVTAPAYAQGYAEERGMVYTKHLQPTTFHKDRLRIQVIDPTPIVTYPRSPMVSEPIVISAPRAAKYQAVASIPANAVAVAEGMYVVPASNGGVGSSNPMLGDLSHLQPVGFTSNVPLQTYLGSRNLQNGTSTGVHSRIDLPPTMVSKPAQTLNRPSKPGYVKVWEPAEIATYPGQNDSVGGSTQTYTKSELKGRILETLLKKQR